MLEELQPMCKTKPTTEVQQHFSIVAIFKDTSAWHMFSGLSSRFYEDPSDASASFSCCITVRGFVRFLLQDLMRSTFFEAA